MIVTNFSSKDSLIYYMRSKIEDHAILVDNSIDAMIKNNDISSFVNSFNQAPEDQNKVHFYNSSNSNSENNYPPTPSYLFYTPDKKSLEDIFKDLITPLQSNFFYHLTFYINPLPPHPFTLFTPFSSSNQNEDFYSLWDKIDVEDINYAAYFKDIRSIISRLHSENKFYIKHIDSLQSEVITLRRQVSDLNEQLNIKTFTTWS